MQRLSPLILLLLALSILHPTTGLAEQRIYAEDPQGDAAGYQVPPEAVAGVDILAVEVYFSDGVVIVILDLTGPPVGDGTYMYRVSIQDQGSDSMYEAIFALGQEVAGQVMNTLVIQVKGGVLLVPITQDMIKVEGSRIIVTIDPAAVNMQDAASMIPGEIGFKQIALVAQATYVSGQGTAGDEMDVLIDLETGAMEEPTRTGGQEAGQAPEETPGETPIGYQPPEPFKDRGSKAPGVDVEITGTPTVRITDTVIDGVPYTIIEVTARGKSSGASHIGMALEVFMGGEMDSQTLYNIATMDSNMDNDGVANGYTMILQLPLGPNLPMLEAKEELMPVGGSWDEWEFRIYYKIPGVQAEQTAKLTKIIQELERGDVEVYLTAIAFKDGGEAQYTTATKKAKLEIGSGSGAGEPVAPEESPQEPSGGQDQQEPGDEGGIPVAAVAIGVVILVALSLIAARFR